MNKMDVRKGRGTTYRANPSQKEIWQAGLVSGKDVRLNISRKKEEKFLL